MFKINQRLGIFVFNSHNCILLRGYTVKKYSRPSAALFSLEEPKKQQVKTEKYKLVYQFNTKNLIFAHSLSRLKLYPFGFTVLGVPTSVILESLEIFPKLAWLSVAVPGLLATGALCGVGVLLRNMVGRIVLLEDKNLLQFHFISFWGNKVVLEIPPEKVKIVSPRFSFESKLYIELKLGDDQKLVKIMRGEALVDEKLFYEFFGFFSL